MLLETRIVRDDGYQKQQGELRAQEVAKTREQASLTQPDTLIVWTETNGTDMALSFQEAEGCAVIWYITPSLLVQRI